MKKIIFMAVVGMTVFIGRFQGLGANEIVDYDTTDTGIYFYFQDGTGYYLDR